MLSAALVDLYVPSHLTDLDALCQRAAEAGLDGIVAVFDASDVLPSDGELHRLATRFGVDVHVGRSLVAANGFRLVVLGADGVPSEMMAAIEATGDPSLIRAALAELGSPGVPIVAYRVGLRQLPGRQAAPQPVGLADPDRIGVMALMVEASLLARDLDCEALGEAGIPVLAGTGPFGQLADIGRHATVLLGHPRDRGGVARALKDGQGFPVEIFAANAKVDGPAAPDPFEGREEEAKPRPKRRRRRRTTKASDAA